MSSRGRQRKRMGEDGWEEWGGYMAAKIQKLKDQVKSDSSHVSRTDIFRGISIFVNGYTKPSAADLKELILEHGGVFHHYYRRELVTHIIASNLPNSKVANLHDKKVCRPDWIMDSIKAGYLLPYQQYLLYSGQSKLQPGLQFKPDNKSKTTSAQKTTLSEDCPCEKVDLGEEQSVEESSSVIAGDPEEQVLCVASSHSSRNSDDSVSKSKPDQLQQQSANKRSAEFRAPSKAGSSNFLSEFYSHSRLHHISTWGAEFKAYVNQLQQQGDHSFPARDKLRQSIMQKLSKEPSTCGIGQKSKLSLKNNKPMLQEGKLQRVIMHIDMDCFFVSVGLRNRPELVGKPVAVTHSRGVGIAKDRPGTDLAYERAYYQNRVHQRNKSSKAKVQALPTDFDLADDLDEGELQQVAENEDNLSTEHKTFHSMAEIASCSYEARKAGVHNGMFMGTAKQLCPDIVTIPYDFEGYNEVSKTLYNTVARYTHDIEAVSCDEMLIDCSDVLADTGASPLEFASLLRQEIHEATGCNASAGIGPNILIARLATKVAKPNGQHYVSPDKVEEFIKDKPVKDIPGVGYSLSSKLLQLGVKTCGDLQAFPLNVLQKELGPKTGQTMYNSCRGMDERPIKLEKERKSVSAEINYGIRFSQESEADHFIKGLAEEVSSRLEKAGVKGKTITLKLKIRKKGAPKETAKFLGHGVCDNIAKSTTIAMATDNPKVIAKEALSLLHAMKIAPEELRGIGMQISRLEAPVNKKSQNNTGSILQFTVIKQQPSTSTTSQNIQKAKKKEHKSNIPTGCKKSDSNHLDQTDKAVDGKQNVEEDKGGTSSTDSDVRRPSLPPLPTLPDVSSLENTYAEPVSKRSLKTPESKTFQSNTIDELMLPSPSQVDEVVLSELPTDIRLQIEAALKRRKHSAGPKLSSIPQYDKITESLEAGCSFWPSQPDVSSKDSHHEGTEKNRPEVDESIVALPSYSQVDPSCLAALPADLRLELERAYAEQSDSAGQRSDKLNRQSEVHPLMRIKRKESHARPPPKSPRRSPRKSPRKSPKLSKKQSPIFKLPQKRTKDKNGKQMAPRKLDFHGRAQSNAKDTTGRRIINDQSTDNKIHTSPQPVPVNIAGAVTLAEVKALMKDWVRSSPMPEDEDLTQFVQYLGDLVWDKNLEMVDLLIKYLYRLLVKEKASSWWNGAMFILQQVQDIVKATHGAVLKVSEAWKDIPH